VRERCVRWCARKTTVNGRIGHWDAVLAKPRQMPFCPRPHRRGEAVNAPTVYSDGVPFGLRVTSTPRSLVVARGGLTGVEVARTELLPVLAALAHEMLPAERRALLLTLAAIADEPVPLPSAPVAPDSGQVTGWTQTERCLCHETNFGGCPKHVGPAEGGR
jgi:hypothetical protein